MSKSLLSGSSSSGNHKINLGKWGRGSAPERDSPHGGIKEFRYSGRRDKETYQRNREEIIFQLINEEEWRITDAEKLRQYLKKLEHDLRQWSKKMNSSDAVEKTLEKWECILPHIEALMGTATQIFLHDTKHFVDNQIDVGVWKYGIYQFIIMFRGVLQESEKNQGYLDAFMTLSQKCVEYYKFLLMKAPDTVGVRLERVFDGTGFLRGSSRSAELDAAENLCYRLFISMGDLYRYIFERSKESQKLRMAANMYRAARSCDTARSRPYYQCGLVLKAQGDIIGTIYNFIRANATSPPIDGIYGQMTAVFDEVLRRFTELRPKYWVKSMQLGEKRFALTRPSKVERWMVPNPKFEKQPYPTVRLPMSKENHLKSLTPEEALTHFSLAFGHFIGVLFTNIGTEFIEDVSMEVVVSFEGLFVSNKVEFNVMMEIFSLMLFLIEHLNPEEETLSDLEAEGKLAQFDYLRDVAFEATLSMLIIVCEKLLHAVKLLDWENPMLTICSAVIHVWCRWMRQNKNLCKELKTEIATYEKNPKQYKMQLPNKFYMICFATSFFRLQDELSKLMKRKSDFFFPEISKGSNENCNTSFESLPEQIMLDGFKEIFNPEDLSVGRYYHDGRFNKTRVDVHFRLARIEMFGRQTFPGISETTLYSNSVKKDSVKLPLEIYLEEKLEIISFIHTSQKLPIRSQIKGEKRATLLESKRPDSNNATVALKSPRKADGACSLKLKSAMESSLITKEHEIWMDLTIKGVRVELYIMPTQLVLDTNCMVRDRDWVRCLLALTKTPLIIPTTVLSELRGLAKGLKTGYSPRAHQNKSLTHGEKQLRTIEAMEVGEECTAALEFLNENKQHFKVVTIAGEEVRMYNFIRQKLFQDQAHQDRRNDEKILDTCAYLELKNTEARKQDTPMRITRNVILLTGDRSLRVQAYAMDIPARDIASFVAWYEKAMSGNSSPTKVSPRTGNVDKEA